MNSPDQNIDFLSGIVQGKRRPVVAGTPKRCMTGMAQ